MPELNKNLVTLFSFIFASKDRKSLVKETAEKSEIRTPMPSVKAKPLMSEVPNQKRITAVMMLEVFESRMENQALSKPNPTASLILLPARISRSEERRVGK